MGIRLDGAGPFLRETKLGSQIATSNLYKVQNGDFIYSRLFAWRGAFGVIAENLDGCYVSGEFPTFLPVKDKIDTEFLRLWFCLPSIISSVEKNCSGSTPLTRNRFKEQFFLNMEIPLPPLSEQRRIVAQIEELAAKVEEAKGLRQKAVNEVAATWHTYLKSIIENGLKKGWDLKPIAEVAEINPPRGKITAYPDDLEVSFVPMSTVDDVTGRITKAETRQLGEVRKGYTFFIDGDVIFARITPCMQNGKSAIAKGLKNGIGFGSTEFHVMRPTSKILAEWLHALVRHKDFKDDAATHFKGTAGQQRVPQSFLESKKIPVPSMSEQHRIVAHLDNLQSKIDELKKLQAETQKELNALMPSILDKAFKGELQLGNVTT